MKRVLTFVICLTLSHVTQAGQFLTNKVSAYPGSVAGTKLKYDTTFVPAVNLVPFTTFQNLSYQHRLDSIQKEVPLNYNEYVQSYIDLYSAPNRRNDIGRILGLSKYYFPIYEKAFRETGIPEEIKYLSIVESELNPNAVSRVGATGPWQFMYATGKAYGLNVNDYVDERRDPIQASYAAAAYLRDAYQEFGDWLLAIASYNCGKSSVERAIDQAGGATDFWSIRQYLPPETRGYVPAYIAVSYIMNYANRHNVIAQSCPFSLKTDTVLVNKMVSLINIARVLDMDAKELYTLNPAYTKGIVNGTATAARRLILPKITNDKYTLLYNTLNNDAATVKYTPTVNINPMPVAQTHPAKMPAYHRVKRGESLADIADMYGIELQDLKAWNNLHSNRAVVGAKLKLSETSAGDDTQAEKKPAKKYVTYIVRPGDTLSVIADKFDGATVEEIKELNGLKKNSLQPGMTLKINKV